MALDSEDFIYLTTHWEPWNDDLISMVRFVKIFCLSLTNFHWFCFFPVPPWSWINLVTIPHVFSIGKEMAQKPLGCFVNSVLKVLRKRTFKYIYQLSFLLLSLWFLNRPLSFTTRWWTKRDIIGDVLYDPYWEMCSFFLILCF
ncbi:hypothetical protein VP01_1875g1 [Puccinia sorghi]|uniref:Uncharacterized protein n=1 Tax=Puccinia sorghi TaxID=27349 RepID=A0A0L6VD53_9BASI|nr:hypothetical protein VP01_1875g1 [Puccinia sorghi]